MTDKDFYTLYVDALSETDRDKYIADWGTSWIFYPDENEGPDTDTVVRTLDDIFAIAHLTIFDIRNHLGMSQAEFALHYCIPKRTVENWEMGTRECAPYIKLMMAALAGMVNRCLKY